MTYMKEKLRTACIDRIEKLIEDTGGMPSYAQIEVAVLDVYAMIEDEGFLSPVVTVESIKNINRRVSLRENPGDQED